jgi:threonyl-tRNA synthetase
MKVKDAIGREWQMSTIQFDFNMPERFDMSYVGADGQEHRPYMVHRALLGSLERFFGILVEHYAGAFPLWLAPEQVRVLPLTEKQGEHAERVMMDLKDAGFRVGLDGRSEKIGARIRDAQMERIPYMAVIGAREVESGSVAVRSRSEGDKGPMEMSAFVAMLRDEVTSKRCSINKGS